MESASKSIEDNIPKGPAKLKDRMSEWLEFGGVGNKYKCAQLGMGTPAWAPPKFLRDAMLDAID